MKRDGEDVEIFKSGFSISDHSEICMDCRKIIECTHDGGADGGRTLGRGTLGRGTLGRRRETRVDSRSGDPHRVDSRSGASAVRSGPMM